jgi:uncharacterized protein
VGGGIAGLGAVWHLAGRHEVELLDAGERPGGHARTERLGPLAIDTGFIVFNEVNYPRLTCLLGELGVRTQPTVMSFSVECGCGVSWSSRRPWRAGRRLLGEILRFLRTARAREGDPRSLDELLRDEGYSESFRQHYLRPMTAALWSAPPGRALDMPAPLALAFFANHGMLGLRRRSWRTVAGGSATYVDALLGRTGVTVHSGVPVRTVARDRCGVTVLTADGIERGYDCVVLAASAPRALALLDDRTDDERRLLGAFEVTRNETVLHTDERLLPRRRSDRAAWNYHVADCSHAGTIPTLTYSANRLQALSTSEEHCITLNRTAEIEPSSIRTTYADEHPMMTNASHAAQAELRLLRGSHRVAFAGAWHGFGFHEDGLVSGTCAAAKLERAFA